MRKAKDKICEN